jgi:hypothetical protein
MAIILNFPSSRMSSAIRVERERDGDSWLTLADACGEAHGSFADALRNAHAIAVELGLSITSSAGRIVP